MMHFEKDELCWKELFADYHMNLICVNEITDFSHYHTSLKLLLMLLANRGSKKKMKKLIRENPEFRKVNKATARVAGILLGVEVAMEKRIEKEGEEIDMCTGLKEWFLEEREGGRKEGRKEGRKDVNKLILKLAEEGRLDDMIRAASDNEYQNQLLQEYSLI